MTCKLAGRVGSQADIGIAFLIGLWVSGRQFSEDRYRARTGV